jgi:hypothetical protein
MTKNIDIESLKKTLKNATNQKRWMYFTLISLTAALFLGDLRVSHEDFKFLLRQVWPSFLVVLMATFWYDYIIKSETRLESELARREIEAEIRNDVKEYLEQEIKSVITDAVTSPSSEHYIFRLVGRKFIKNDKMLSEYVRFTANHLFSQPTYYNLSAKLFLRRTRDSKSYLLDKKESFEYFIQKESFVVAFSSDVELLNILSHQINKVDYIINIPHSLEMSIQDVHNHTNLTAYVSSQEKVIKSKLMDCHESDEFLQECGLNSKHSPELGLISFNVSELKGLVRLEINQQVTLSLGDCICQWFANRLTYLNNVEFHYSEVSIGRKFKAQHFFSDLPVKSINDKERKIVSIEYNGWVTKGQGASISWRG